MTYRTTPAIARPASLALAAVVTKRSSNFARCAALAVAFTFAIGSQAIAQQPPASSAKQKSFQKTGAAGGAPGGSRAAASASPGGPGADRSAGATGVFTMDQVLSQGPARSDT